MTTCSGEEVTDSTFLPIDLLMLLTATWITLAVAFQDIDWTNKGFQLLDNVKFWIYSLYAIAIALTVGRYVIVGCTEIEPDLVAIVYNWAASLIVIISSIVPWRFIKNKMRVVNFAKDNFRLCIGALIALLVPLMVTAVLLANNWSDTATMLIVWRVIFTISVFCEITILTSLLVHVNRTVQETGGSLPNSFVYSMGGTLWMRVGIVGSIALKLCGVLDSRFLKVIHTAFIISGFAFYYRKQLSAHAQRGLMSSSRIQFSQGSKISNRNIDKL